MNKSKTYDKYFLSYSGASLPLKLVSQVEPGEIENRNTYFGADFDNNGRITVIQKSVYGEIELSHYYHYHANGNIKSADIHNIENEGVRLHFDETGKVTFQEMLDVQ